MRGGAAALLLAIAAAAGAEPVEEVLRVDRGDYAIAALVTRMPEANSPRHAVLLFPGSPGILRLTEENGRARFGMQGNFLVRSRREWLAPDLLVATVDAPSDQWRDFSQRFRATPRYGEDIAALAQALARRYGVGDFTFVGTSEGTVSAFQAARMHPELARRLILSSSIFVPTRIGPGLSAVDWKAYPGALLWVHHEEDPCEYTAYSYARRYARDTGSPLVTVHGGGPYRGGACEAFSAHGYAGVERETVLAMREWIRTGKAPADVAR